MNTERASRRAEVVDEVSKWTVGAGILVVALAPLSLPILVLTAVALLPLLVPLLALGLIAAVLAVPILLARRAARWLRLRQQVPVGAAVKEQRLAVDGVRRDHVAGEDQVVPAVDQVPQLAGHPHQRPG
jgi:hypothetical protein